MPLSLSFQDFAQKEKFLPHGSKKRVSATELLFHKIANAFWQLTEDSQERPR